MRRKIPCKVKRLRAGELLRQIDGPRCAIVVSADSEGRHGTLMQMPGGRSYQATLDDVRDWEIIRLPGPRLVHVRGLQPGSPSWSAYLPNFESARALWRELEGSNPGQFEVEICTQHVDEKLALQDIGYYAEPPTRKAG
jgi:hypothetical protein